MTPADLRSFRRGEEWIFRRLIAEHSPRLLAYLRSYAVDRAEAEEWAQATWVRVFERRGALRSGGSFLGWLLVIGRSVALDEKRRLRRAPSAPDATVAAPGPAPNDIAERAERAERVRRAVLELPDRQRETVVLRMLEGRTTRETALAMGCAEGTVKAALHRALRTLAGRLNGLMDPEEIDESA